MTTIHVSSELVKVGMSARNAAFMGDEQRVRDILEAVFQHLSQHPIVPTDEQAMSLLDYFHDCSSGYATRDTCVEWVRRMFLAEPEIPEEIKDLLWQSTPQQMDILSVTRLHDEDVSEAYRRGRRSKG